MRWSQHFNICVLSCGCKTACTRNCKCKNAGLKCINMWSGCGGRICNDSDPSNDVHWVQHFPVLHARNVAALFNFNSFSESHIHTQSFTPLPWGGGHHHNTQTLLYIYENVMLVRVITWQRPEGRIRVWDSEQLIWSIENIYISSQCNL